MGQIPKPESKQQFINNRLIKAGFLSTAFCIDLAQSEAWFPF